MDYKDYYAEAVHTKKAVDIWDCTREELIKAIAFCNSSIQADILNRVNAERYKKAATKAVLGMKPKRHKLTLEEEKKRRDREKTMLVLSSILSKKGATGFYNAISRRCGTDRPITLDYLKQNVSYADALNTRGVGKATADLVRPLLKEEQ